MAFHTPPDIAGDSAVHNLGDYALAQGYPGLEARSVQFVVSGTGTVRVGDSNTTSSRGLPIPSGGGLTLPYVGELAFYPLPGIYAYIPTGATLSFSFES